MYDAFEFIMLFTSGYIVEYQEQGSQKWVKLATLEPSCTQYCCENLKEKSEFTFRVLAENSVGLSPPASTERISLKTHASMFIFVTLELVVIFDHL